jgi:hypothetical protein
LRPSPLSAQEPAGATVTKRTALLDMLVRAIEANDLCVPATVDEAASNN